MRFEVDRTAGEDEDRLEDAGVDFGPAGPAPGSLTPERRVELGADRSEQRPSLVEALLELPGRVGVGNDSAADSEPDLAARHLERPDGDVQLESG